MLHLVSACTTCGTALNSLPSRPSLPAVIARESLRFDQSAVSCRKTQNWNWLIMRCFYLWSKTRPGQKHRFSAPKAQFWLIFYAVLRDPSRRIKPANGKKCLIFGGRLAFIRVGYPFPPPHISGIPFPLISRVKARSRWRLPLCITRRQS